MVAVVWILVTVALVAVELHHLAFFAMFAAAGSLAAAVVALIDPTAYVAQVLVGVVIAAIGLVAIRPQVSKTFARQGAGVSIGGVHGGLVGARGVTLDEVGLDNRGHVRLLGENWLAVTADIEAIPPSTPVIVTQVVGTTLTVRAVTSEWEFT